MGSEDSGSRTEQCTNMMCSKEADHQVVLVGVSPDPYPYCDEHYKELKSIEGAEGVQ